MWSLVRVITTNAGEESRYLKEGYEPFAVTPLFNAHLIWMKKEVEDEVPDKRDEPVKRTGRRTVKKS